MELDFRERSTLSQVRHASADSADAGQGVS
jgi:hypothetical protein